jgi:hypothetical protein
MRWLATIKETAVQRADSLKVNAAILLILVGVLPDLLYFRLMSGMSDLATMGVLFWLLRSKFGNK